MTLNLTDRRPEINSRKHKLPAESQQRISELVELAQQEDREYQMHLAAIREAGHLTQTEIAKRLGTGQGNVSRTEKANDMLFSTLRAYLEAAGAKDIAITATVGNKRVEILLNSIQN